MIGVSTLKEGPRMYFLAAIFSIFCVFWSILSSSPLYVMASTKEQIKKMSDTERFTKHMECDDMWGKELEKNGVENIKI